MRKAADPRVVACLATLVFVLSSACAVNPPGISSESHRLIVMADGPNGARSERLSIFLAVSDKDGLSDLDRLFILHDESELSWTLTPDTWQVREEGSRISVGSNGLSPPSGNALPRGRYRALLYDLAGERADYTFTVSAPNTADYALPSLSLDRNTVRIDSPYPTNTAFFLDSGGNVTRTVAVKPGSIDLDTLWGDGAWRSDADYLAVYGLDPGSELGLFSWKIRLPD
ncbi:MAG: hypothetical protein E4H20_07930 [Spirochaetales bacterium]|nr:MAG: hypothetical protein E4H20_07930 [Spirochaetales bacterium]